MTRVELQSFTTYVHQILRPKTHLRYTITLWPQRSNLEIRLDPRDLQIAVGDTNLSLRHSRSPARAYTAEHCIFRILTIHQWMNRPYHCSSQGFLERPSSLTITCEVFCIHMYRTLNTIFHVADSRATNLEFTTFIVLFKMESFTITGRCNIRAQHPFLRKTGG